MRGTAVFLNADPETTPPALRANLEACGLGADRAAVVVGDALGNLGGHHDLALLDPPYAFAGWDGLLAALDAEVAVCESDAEIVPPAGWAMARTKAYGGTVVTICTRGAPR